MAANDKTIGSSMGGRRRALINQRRRRRQPPTDLSVEAAHICGQPAPLIHQRRQQAEAWLQMIKQLAAAWAGAGGH